MTKSLLILFSLFHSYCFNNNNETKQDILSSVNIRQLQVNVTSKKEMLDTSFLSFWKEFTDVLKNKNKKRFREMSFDSLEYKGKNIHLNSFMKSYFSKVFDDNFFNALCDKNKLDFIVSKVDISYLPKLISKQLKKGKCVEKIVNITTEDKYPPIIIILKFIETKTGYKFYKYDKVG